MYSVAIPRQFKEKTVTSAFLLSHSSTLYNALIIVLSSGKRAETQQIKSHTFHTVHFIWQRQ